MDAHQIIPYLYLGSRDYTILDLYNLEIHVAICMAPEDQVETIEDEHILFLRYPVSFQQSDNISKKNMQEAVATCISHIYQCKNVYLHCVAGYNRSAAVAVLVVEQLLSISRQEAITMINKIHPIKPEKHLALVDQPDTQPVLMPTEYPMYYSICRSWSDGEDHDPEEENSYYNFHYFKIYEDDHRTIICSNDAIIMECIHKEELEHDKIHSYISSKQAKEHATKAIKYVKGSWLFNHVTAFIKKT